VKSLKIEKLVKFN